MARKPKNVVFIGSLLTSLPDPQVIGIFISKGRTLQKIPRGKGCQAFRKTAISNSLNKNVTKKKKLFLGLGSQKLVEEWMID